MQTPHDQKRPLALITGASSGIGREFTIIHAKNGGDCLIIARREEELLTLKNELESTYGVTVHTLDQDLTEPGAIKIIMNYLKSHNLSVDYLINNAGFGAHGLFADQDIEKLSSMITLNCIAVTQLTHALLPTMLDAGRGKILNVGSTAGMIPGPLSAVYFASKAYVNSFSKALRKETEGTGVTVTVLMPGPVQTEFGEVSDMEDTAGFKEAATAQETAQDGYDAMIKGSVTKISTNRPFFKILLALVPLFPIQAVLSMVKQSQEKEQR